MVSDPGVRPIDDVRRSMYRAQILGAAESEFSRTGFAGTKVTAIAKAADLSLATVYKHFSGKEEIWDALHADRMAELLAEVEEAGATTASPLARIMAGIGAVARYLARHDAYLDMSLWAGAGWASSRPAAYGVQRTVWSAGQETLVAGMRSALDAGEVRGLEPRVAAGLVIASLQVWLAEWVAGGRHEDAEELVAAMLRRVEWMLVGPDE
ncbi:TetR/AcrR family transcriptional regulator [Nocardioides sp. YIM 152588]|uniref:TetR/AcrR family transcriptional regulator n=1 Tax=Nocardioides sp. YIM 152588 TaxID=3158259 RepID=UPI0032E4570E